MFSPTIMSRAHEESAIKAMRVGKAWEGKRKQIDRRKLTARCPAWLSLSEDKTQFTVIEDRKKVIRDIFSMKLVGKGATAIVKELNQTAKWKPGSNNKRKQAEGWRESYVKKILRNRAVIGEFQLHKFVNGKRQPVGDPISGYFPVVVDKGDFYQVQKQFKQNSHRGGKTGKVSNLFTHLLKCGYCKGSMAIIDKGPAPKGGKYLVCDRSRRGIDCCKATIKYDEVEHLVLQYCKGLHPQEIMAEHNDTAITLLKNEIDGIEGELNSIKAEIETLTDSISTTPDKRVRETLEKRMSEKFDERYNLTEKMNHLKQQLDSLSQSSATTQATLDSITKLFDFLSTVKEQKLIDTRLRLRKELQRLIKGIEVFTAGHARLTKKNVDIAVRAIAQSRWSHLTPEGYVLLQRNIRQQVNPLKYYCTFDMRFTSGSLRTISLGEAMPLTNEYDAEKDARLTYTPDGRYTYTKTFTTTEGQTVFEEYSMENLLLDRIEFDGI